MAGTPRPIACAMQDRSCDVELRFREVYRGQVYEPLQERADVAGPPHTPYDAAAVMLLHPLQASKERRPGLARAPGRRREEADRLAARYMPASYGRWMQVPRAVRAVGERSGELAVPPPHWTEGDCGASGEPLDRAPPRARRFAVTEVNHRRRCAELRPSQDMKQGSSDARFGALVHVRSEHGRLDGGRLGDADRGAPAWRPRPVTCGRSPIPTEGS